MSKKISIGAWSCIWGEYTDDPIPLPTVAKRLNELEFDGIELAAFPPHLDPQDYPTTKKRLKIKKILDDNGLEASGLLANFGAVSSVFAKPEKYLEVTKTNLDICVDLEIPKLRVDTINPPTDVSGGLDYETAFKRVAEVWNRAAQVCQEAGVLLIWEFEPAFLFNKPGEVVRMVKEVDHLNFKILFDTCHAYMCSVVAARQVGEKETLSGGVAEFAGLLKGQIGHLHLTDSDGTLHNEEKLGVETSAHVPLGSGLLNFDEIVPAVLEAGYTDDWWTIDLCFTPKAMEVMPQDKAFVDELVEKYG